MHPTPLQRLFAAVPPALLLGFALALITDPALIAYQVHVGNSHDEVAMARGFARAGLLSSAMWVTTQVLIALGVYEASRRVGRGDRGVLLAASILLWLLAARAVLWLYPEYVAPEGRRFEVWFRWGARFSFVTWLATSVLLTIAVRRRGALVVTGVAALLIATAIVNAPLRSMRSWFYFDGWDDHAQWKNAALGVAYSVAQALAFIVAIYQACLDAPPLAGTTARVAEGVGRIGTALVARVLIAMGFAVAMLLAIGARSPGLLQAAAVLVPSALLFAMIAMITGMFQAAGNAGADAPPRWRFTLAGALTLIWLVMISVQAICAYRVLHWRLDRDGGHVGEWETTSVESTVAAFPYLGAAIALGGVLALVSALASLRRQRGGLLGSADPATAAALVSACTICAAYVQQWAMRKDGHPGSYLVLILLFSVASIIGQLAVARLCHKVADGLALDAPTGLPVARVHNPDPEA